MANLSVFPDSIDTFVKHYDIQPRDVENIKRYQVLKLKETLTQAEQDELNNLTMILRDKIFIAEDFNKLQDCITNLETFFKYQTEDYINQKFTAYDVRMVQMETKANVKMGEVDDKIAETDVQMSEIDAWYASVKADIAKLQTFDFENMPELKGCSKKTIFNQDGSITQNIYVTSNNKKVADKLTVFNQDGSITVTIKLYNEDGASILRQSAKTTYFEKDGSIREEVI